MADRSPTTRSLFLLFAGLFLLAFAAAAGAEEAVEAFKGTVVEFKDGSLTLKDVPSENDLVPPRSVIVLTDAGTAFFDGATQVSKDDIVPDLLVLVRCTVAGQERRAVLVRIIGGKKS